MVADNEQSDGQKTFRLARLFHTEDCYRARALTAEELVRGKTATLEEIEGA